MIITSVRRLGRLWARWCRIRPPVHLVHGEARGREGLAARLQTDYGVDAGLPAYGDTIHL